MINIVRFHISVLFFSACESAHQITLCNDNHDSTGLPNYSRGSSHDSTGLPHNSTGLPHDSTGSPNE